MVNRDTTRKVSGMRVLELIREDAIANNPYIAQTVTAVMGAGADVFFQGGPSWRTRRYDIIHVHWPDQFFRSKTIIGSMTRCLHFLLLLIMWRMRGSKIVWTVHNESPHEKQNILESITDTVFRKIVSGVILINNSSDIPCGVRNRVNSARVLHGNYVDWMSRYPKATASRGVIGYVGILRPYKGIEQLINAFSQIPDKNLQLRISGNPLDPFYSSDLQETSPNDSRIFFDFGFLSEAELVQSITKCELVVLPYRKLHNSGALLLALSLERPVLVPATEATRSLLDEFGGEWIYLYNGILNGEILRSVLMQASADERATPRWTSRTWDATGNAHVRFFEEVRAA